jgi:hypothetical protein
MTIPAGFPVRIQFSWIFVQAVVPSAQLALGLYLFFGGEWIVNRAIPSNRPYCPECGYDLSRSRREHCPECGVTLPGTPESH